ncbi:unnamed protein product [Discula destructiva]
MGSADRGDDLVVFDDADATGQTCRMAILMSAITLTPVRIEKRKGMTLHLVEIVDWFTKETAAKSVGNVIGSEALEFHPKQRANSKLTNTLITIIGDKKNKFVDDATKKTHQETLFVSKAKTSSAVATLQTMLPLLLMIGNHSGHKFGREILIEGATNCPDAPSFEYLKQVFEPALKEYFGIEMDCKLEQRGWGQIPVSKGKIKVKFTPLAIDSTIKVQQAAQMNEEQGLTGVDTDVQEVVATIVAPASMHTLMHDTLREAMVSTFNYIEDDAIKISMDDNTQGNHAYIIMVAHSSSSRWARDWINSEPLQGNKDLNSLYKGVSKDLCKALEKEVSSATECPVDQFLQDQLIVYQALAEGTSAFQRQKTDGNEVDDAEETKHVRRARITAMMMLPAASFTEAGICTGAGVKVGQHVHVDMEKKQQLEKQ